MAEIHCFNRVAGKGTVRSACRLFQVPYDASQFPLGIQRNAAAVSPAECGPQQVVQLTATASAIAADAPSPRQGGKAQPLGQTEAPARLAPQSQMPPLTQASAARRRGSRGGPGGVAATALPLQDCHLLCQAALLAYEDSAVVRAVLAGCDPACLPLHCWCVYTATNFQQVSISCTSGSKLRQREEKAFQKKCSLLP